MRLFLAVAASLSLALAGGVLVPLGLSAQQPLEFSVVQVDASDPQDTKLLINLLDGAGRPIPLESGPELVVEVDGTPVPVKTAETASDARLGVGVVLTIDTSGSMEGEPLQSAKFAVRSFIDQLLPADRVAVLAFADVVTLTQPFTADRGAAVAASAQLEAVGNTALYAAVVESTELASRSPLPRQAVLLLSDGTEYGGVSGISREETLARARELGVPFYTVALGGGVDSAFLDELAAETGGRSFVATDPSGLAALYQSSAQLLRSQILLHVDLSDFAARSVEVTVSANYQGATAVDTVTVELPFVPPPAPAPATPAAVPEIHIAAQPSEGSTNIVLLSVVGVVGALLGAGFLIRWRWQRRWVPLDPQLLQGSREGQPTEPAATPQEVLAELLVQHPGQGPFTVEIGRAPVTLGAGSGCTVPLPVQLGRLRLEQARIWLAGDRFLFHDLSHRPRSRLGGVALSWAVLDDGDEIEIGETRLVFQMRPSSRPVAEPASRRKQPADLGYRPQVKSRQQSMAPEPSPGEG